jgi:hypothetical protein
MTKSASKASFGVREKVGDDPSAASATKRRSAGSRIV